MRISILSFGNHLLEDAGPDTAGIHRAFPDGRYDLVHGVAAEAECPEPFRCHPLLLKLMAGHEPAAEAVTVNRHELFPRQMAGVGNICSVGPGNNHGSERRDGRPWGRSDRRGWRCRRGLAGLGDDWDS